LRIVSPISSSSEKSVKLPKQVWSNGFTLHHFKQFNHIFLDFK
jgi:hypothetical protein